MKSQLPGIKNIIDHSFELISVIGIRHNILFDGRSEPEKKQKKFFECKQS